MLVLSRRPGERIVIQLPTGETIIIGIGSLDVATNSAKVGVDAPRHISVDREEIWMKKQQDVQPCQPTVATSPRITKKDTLPLSLKTPLTRSS